jgi:hypothetical protein
MAGVGAVQLSSTLPRGGPRPRQIEKAVEVSSGGGEAGGGVARGDIGLDGAKGGVPEVAERGRHARAAQKVVAPLTVRGMTPEAGRAAALGQSCARAMAEEGGLEEDGGTGKVITKIVPHRGLGGHVAALFNEGLEDGDGGGRQGVAGGADLRKDMGLEGG